MDKRTFLEAMNTVRAHKDWDVACGPFTCNVIEKISYEMREAYQYLLSREDCDSWIPACFYANDEDYLSDEEARQRRELALAMFEETCLAFKLYKDF